MSFKALTGLDPFEKECDDQKFCRPNIYQKEIEFNISWTNLTSRTKKILEMMLTKDSIERSSLSEIANLLKFTPNTDDLKTSIDFDVV